MKQKFTLFILTTLFYVLYPGIQSNSEDISFHVSVNEENLDPFDGISYSLYTYPDNEYDNFATIDNYANAKNVIKGVFTIPTEITYKGITYPIMGVDSLNSSETIKEVIVPKDFGSKKLNLPFEYTAQAGNSNFFSLPNVPKVTIYADNINIADLVIDGTHVLEQNGRITSASVKSLLQEVNIYSDTARIKKYAISDYPNLKILTFAKHTQLIMDKYAIVNLTKLDKLNLPANTKFTEGSISFCSNLKEISFMGESLYYVIPENGGIISPSNTLLFVPSDTENYTTTEDTNKIGDLAFTCSKNLKEVNSNAKIIGEYAFMGCKNLSIVNLTNNTEKIEDFAFSNCNLSAFQLPKSVNTLGHGVLYNNKNLSTIKTEGINYKFKKGVLTTFSGKTLIAAIPIEGKVIIPSGVVTTRTAPITAPLEVHSLSFPASLRNFYQMGQEMKKLTKVTFKGIEVPKALVFNSQYDDPVNLKKIGYGQGQICIAYDQKVTFDIPSSQKKVYQKFIKQICPASNHIFI